jgi:hypothetical protein
MPVLRDRAGMGLANDFGFQSSTQAGYGSAKMAIDTWWARCALRIIIEKEPRAG